MLTTGWSNFPWSLAGKLVVLVLVEELGSSDEGLRWVSVFKVFFINEDFCVLANSSFLFRLKGLVEKVAADYRETYSRSEFSQKHLTTACQLKSVWFFSCVSDWLTDCLIFYLPIRSFIFGFMEGSDYIQGLVMGWVYSHVLLMRHRCQPPVSKVSHLISCGWSEVTLPSLIAVDLSIDAYFLPLGATKKEKDLLDFLDGILDGSIQVSPD